jgi:predicted nucleic acid-binding protein
VRIFLDANVLFSAALSAQGRAGTLIRVAIASRCTLLASAHVTGEAERNIALKVPGALVRLASILAQLELTEDAGDELVAWAGEVGLPPKDAPVLAAAVLARADLLVTGDQRHFGSLYGKTLRGVRVVTSPDAIALVAEAAGE